MFPKYRLLYYLLSGILLGSGFIFSFLWPLSLLGGILFLYLVSKSETLKSAILGGYLVWTIKSAFAVSWFWSTYPIEWIDLSLGKYEVVVVGFYWLTVSMFLGLGGLVFAWLVFKLKNLFGSLYGLLLFPVFWIVGEIFGSLMFAFFTSGEGSSLNTSFSFGYTGYLLANNALFIQIASFGGVYILTVVFVFCFYLGWLGFKYFSRPQFIIIGIFIVTPIGFFGGEGLKKDEISTEKNITVAIVDTAFGGEFFSRLDKDNYKSTQISEAVEAALLIKPDYIILPEDSRFSEPGISLEMSYRLFRFQNSDPTVVLIDSGLKPIAPDSNALRAAVYDGISKNTFTVDKQYLVPQGEFMPYFSSLTLRMFGMKKAAETVNKKLAYRPGPLNIQSLFPEHVPGVLFCFESVDPLGVRKLVKEREVSFIAHPISHAWFHESKILWYQQDLMLKVQAIWNQVDIVSAGNMSKGFLYTKKGQKVIPTSVASGESWQVSLVEL